MFLEESIHSRVKQELDDPQYRRYIGTENLESITNQDVEDFQLFRLRKILAYVSEKSTHYRDLFSTNGVEARDIQSCGDLARIPFTEPNDLVERPYKLLCVPLGGVARIFTHNTSGTTGAPKKVFFTENDIDIITDCMAAIMKTAVTCGGLDPCGHTVYILLPDGLPMSQGKLVARGVEKMGGSPVVGNITQGIEEQITLIEKARPAMLMGSASRIYHITQETRSSHDLAQIGVKILFITSEYVSAGMRRNLENWWNTEVFHHYGMTETGLASAIECQAHDGFHFNQADFLFEIVDPATGAILKDGEEGEVVFSMLRREGMPLIRYRTGDIARLIREPCECGALTPRIGKIARRTKSTVIIGTGQELYPSLLDDVLYEIPDLVDYRIFLSKDGDGDCLTCRVEVLVPGTGIKDRLVEALLTVPPIRKSVDARLLAEPRIELVELGSLRREGRAKQRIIIDSH